MKGYLLKFYIIFIFSLLFSFYIRAQDFRYIYIQTEDQTAFYVKMGDQTLSSSSGGYIIIPKLPEGSYKITVGFPKTSLPELFFAVYLGDKDAGYILKNDPIQGLYIMDFQTKKFFPSEIRLVPVKKQGIIKSKDEFARILAEVVNDSTINEIQLFRNAEQTIAKTEIVKPAENPVTAQPATVVNDKTVVEVKTGILKLNQKNTSEGLSLKYIDATDTVDVFMQVTNSTVQQVITQKSMDTLIVAKKETEPVKDVKFIDMELQNPNQLADSGTAKKVDFVITQKKEALATSLATNSKCKSTATQKDFLDLRKRMAAQKTETAMQRMVITEFNKTCFTTEHIKNLGVLFITEEERYKFYVSAYPHVSDVENFAALQSQLTDNYFIDRFKAMLTR